METHELRSEILSSGVKYHIQSNVAPAQRAIVTSLFHDGNLLSKQVEHYDSNATADEVRRSVRRLHDERCARITSLLDIRENLKKDVDGRAHLKLGQALYRQKLFKEAMAEVVRSIKLGLEDASGYSILGNCLISIDDYDKAMRSFQKGISIAPTYPDLHNDLGVTYLRLDRCREAAQSFEKALQLNPYYQSACLNLAVVMARNVVLKQDYELSRGLDERMKQLLQTNLQLKPSLDTPEFRAVMSAVADGEYEAVHSGLVEIREDQEKIAHNDLSLELYLVMKFRPAQLDEEEIERFAAKIRMALESSPGYADLQNDLGLLYAAKCKLYIDRAVTSFGEALKLNPQFRKAEKNLKLASNDRHGIHFLIKALLD